MAGSRRATAAVEENVAAREPNYDAIVAAPSTESTSQAARLMSNAYDLPQCLIHTA